MGMRLKTNKIILFIIVNIILIVLLYSIPIKDNTLLEKLCIYKQISGRECWNCGMTRAFLSTLHGDFENAITYNSKVIFVFPLTIYAYLYSWYKFIIKENN